MALRKILNKSDEILHKVCKPVTEFDDKLGQLLDPFVDRLLMISGVLGLFFVGRLPLWIIVVVVARDLIMLCLLYTSDAADE